MEDKIFVRKFIFLLFLILKGIVKRCRRIHFLSSLYMNNIYEKRTTERKY